jgi:hypothetical protein
MRYELSDFEWAAIKPMLPNSVMIGLRAGSTNSGMAKPPGAVQKFYGLVADAAVSDNFH